MGMTYFKRYRMEMDLATFQWVPPELPDGYALCPWDESLLEAHADTKFRCFRYEIDAHVFPSLGHLDGCLRLMGEIARGEEFVPQATWLVEFHSSTHRRPERCATIQGIRGRRDSGSVQNVGVVPEHRGLGLGTYLLVQSLRGFRETGLRRVSLEVTARNIAAQRLYRRLGFRTTRVVYKAAEVAYA